MNLHLGGGSACFIQALSQWHVMKTSSLPDPSSSAWTSFGKDLHPVTFQHPGVVTCWIRSFCLLRTLRCLQAETPSRKRMLTLTRRANSSLGKETARDGSAAALGRLVSATWSCHNGRHHQINKPRSGPARCFSHGLIKHLHIDAQISIVGGDNLYHQQPL